MSEWQPIATAPLDGTPVLLTGGYVDHPSVAAWDGREWVGMVDGCSAVRYMSDFGTEYLTVELPAYWMPLPDTPEQTVDKQGEVKTLENLGPSTEGSHLKSG